MILNRQIGFFIAQIRYYKSLNLLSEINDLDYLRVIESRINLLSKSLFNINLLSEDPLTELSRQYQSLKDIFHLLGLIDQEVNSKDQVMWIESKNYVTSKIEYHLARVEERSKKIDSLIKQLQDFVDYAHTVKLWDEGSVICPYLLLYGEMYDESSNAADSNNDGFLSFDEIEAFKLEKKLIPKVLHLFISDKTTYTEQRVSSLYNEKNRIISVKEEYEKLYKLCEQDDLYLNTDDKTEAFKLLDRLNHYPELEDFFKKKLISAFSADVEKQVQLGNINWVYDFLKSDRCFAELKLVIKKKLKPISSFVKEIEKLKLEVLRVNDFLPKNSHFVLTYPTVFDGNKDLKIIYIIEKLHRADGKLIKKFYDLPHGSQAFLGQHWSELREIMDLLENFYKHFKKSKLRTWIILATSIVAIISLVLYLF